MVTFPVKGETVIASEPNVRIWDTAQPAGGLAVSIRIVFLLVGMPNDFTVVRDTNSRPCRNAVGTPGGSRTLLEGRANTATVA